MRFTAHLLPVVPSTGFAHKLATYFSQCGTEETLEHREKAEQWGREGVGGCRSVPLLLFGPVD